MTQEQVSGLSFLGKTLGLFNRHVQHASQNVFTSKQAELAYLSSIAAGLC